MSSAAVAQYGIETPLPLQPAAGYFRLEGWALLPGAPGPTRTRLRVGDRIFEPEAVIDRPDVAAAFPNDPHALTSGFRFVCYLPFGLHLGELEVASDGADWKRLRPLSIPVSSHPLLGAFEKPAPGTLITSPVRIEGWCFHPEFEIAAVALRFGNIEVPCDHGLPRADVAARFPDMSRAGRSGFITSENLPRGSGKFTLRVATRCGRTYFLASELQGRIRHGADAPQSPLGAVRTPLTVPAAGHRSAPSAGGSNTQRPPPGPRNILFALYGDFTCNSALHVAALANELIERGYDCVVAGPSHKETITTLPRARFMALEFAERDDLAAYFVDHRGPAFVHAWTPRENVRRFASDIRADYGVPVFVHLEDNEAAILASALGRPVDELLRLPAAELDALVPEHLSHPRQAAEFLRSAAGVTTIVDRLREFVPAGVPALTFWPAADPAVYHPRPINHELRRSLGLSPADTVLFYHGNVHAANAAEVASLYEAVARLNRRGRPTYLVRTGRDDAGLMTGPAEAIRSRLLHLGFLAAAGFIPDVMQLADYFVQPGQPGAFNDYRFPSKLPEFFALGRPVVLPRSNLGAVVRHGEDAYVLADANAETITEAILELQANPELVARLSAGAVAFAEREFSWKASASRLLEFYRRYSPLGDAGGGI